MVHADETTLKILNTKKGGKSCSGYLWATSLPPRPDPLFPVSSGAGCMLPLPFYPAWPLRKTDAVSGTQPTAVIDMDLNRIGFGDKCAGIRCQQTHQSPDAFSIAGG